MDLATAPQTAFDSPASGDGVDWPDESTGQSAAPAPISLSDGVHTLTAAEAQMPAFRQAWAILAQRAAEPNSFFEDWFLLPSITAFGRASGLSVMALYQGGALVGLMPVTASTDYYGHRLPHIAAWLHENAFCGAPLIARGHEDYFWRSVLGALDRHNRTALFAHLPALPVDGPAFRSLQNVCAEDGRRAVIVDTRTRAMLMSRKSSAAYCADALSKKHRKELARQMRRLAEHGAVEVTRACNAEGLGAWAQSFLKLEASGWKSEAGTALATSEAAARFFVSVIEGAGAEGRLERLTLSLAGRPIAMLATFLSAPGAYSFKTAYDESLARYSPGLQLQLEYLATLDRGDARWTDSCAAEGHPMISRLWQQRRSLVSCNVALGGGLRRALARPLMAYETRKKAVRR